MRGMMNAMSETNQVNKMDTASRDDSVNARHDEAHGHNNKHDEQHGDNRTPRCVHWCSAVSMLACSQRVRTRRASHVLHARITDMLRAPSRKSDLHLG